jgi:Replication-relaxation
VNTRSVETPTRERARARPRTDRLRLHSIAVWITERDERICIDVFEHRVLTTIQLYELPFPELPKSQETTAGASQAGAPVADSTQRPARIPLRSRARMLGSSRLRHLRETSGFFTRLAHACRLGEHPCRLGRWWGECTCATLIGAMASVIGSALTYWSPSTRSAAP